MAPKDAEFVTLIKFEIKLSPGEFARPRRELWIEKLKGDRYYRAIMVTSSSMIDLLFQGTSVETITFSALVRIHKMFPGCEIERTFKAH